MRDGVEGHVDDALEHLRHLTIDIGPRPSTRDGEGRAARYVAGVMRASGLRDVRCEPFQSGRSTYQPYAMAIGAGLLGNLMYLLVPHRDTLFAAAVLNGLGALGFFREANFDANWMRRLLPRHASQNVIGVIPPRGECRQRAVVVAHLDSHRTPIFYGNLVWARIFSPLAAGVLASLGVSSIAAGWGLWAEGSHLEWVQPLATVVQALVLGLLIHAETTPYTAGANDNASGAATILALGQRLAQEPLRYTEVWVVNTGCEEVGAGGIAALLSAHGDALREAYFLDFDMVGIGSPGLLTREGLLRGYCPDPGLLDLARKVAAQRPGLIAGEHKGGAYTDMGVVIKRGFRGLVIDSIVPHDHPAKDRMGYWHQREDTYDKIEPDCLAKAHRLGWAILQSIDQKAT
jgi:hypothetical protein